MVAVSCCSVVSLSVVFLRRVFRSAGLKPKLISIDDETTLHCWVPASSTTVEKPPLLLVHGFGPSPLFQWRYQVRPLSHFFDLYVPDLVFFGKSTTDSSQRSEVFQARCLAKLMDNLGVKRFSVVGTSYGGFVAYHLGTLFRDRVERVVIASSGVNRRRRHNVELMERAKVGRISDLMLPATTEKLRTLIGLSVFKPPRLMPDFLLKDIINTLYVPNREKKLQLLTGITLGHDDDVRISPLEQEVMIIWGEYDQIFPLENAYELKGLIGERAKLEVMKKTSHMPQIEHPHKFNEIIKSFLLSPPTTSK